MKKSTININKDFEICLNDINEDTPKESDSIVVGHFDRGHDPVNPRYIMYKFHKDNARYGRYIEDSVRYGKTGKWEERK